jgi:hypothetical protein
MGLPGFYPSVKRPANMGRRRLSDQALRRDGTLGALNFLT